MRDIESVKTEKLKFELDKFLKFISDEPKMPNYVTAGGYNSIRDQQSHLWAQGIYQIGGVADSAAKQALLLRNHSNYPSKYCATTSFEKYFHQSKYSVSSQTH